MDLSRQRVDGEREKVVIYGNHGDDVSVVMGTPVGGCLFLILECLIAVENLIERRKAVVVGE